MSDRAEIFEEFYLRDRDRALRAVAANIGDLGHAEELVAEAFSRAFRDWSSLCSHPAPVAWIVMTAMNMQKDQWRRNRVTASRSLEPTLAVNDSSQRLSVEVLSAIHELPERQREVVIHRVLLDLDTQTTARVLSIEPGTVTTHLRRGLAALRGRLADQFEQQPSISQEAGSYVESP